MEKAFARVKAGLPAPVRPTYPAPMSQRDEDRARRLAESLRENLKRRKAQARAVDGAAEPTPCPDAPSEPPR